MYDNCPNGASCNWCCPRHQNHHGSECSWNCPEHRELKYQALNRGNWNTQTKVKEFDPVQLVLGIIGLPFIMFGLMVIIQAVFAIKHSVWVISFPYFRWEDYQPFDRFLSVVLVHLKASFSGGALLHHFGESLGLGNWRYLLVPFGVALNMWSMFSTLGLPLFLWRERRRLRWLYKDERQFLWLASIGFLAFVLMIFFNTSPFFAISLGILYLFGTIAVVWCANRLAKPKWTVRAEGSVRARFPITIPTEMVGWGWESAVQRQTLNPRKWLLLGLFATVVSWGCGFYFGFANHVATFGK